MSASIPITAAIVRDAAVCERRLWHDLHTPIARRADTSPLAELLWEQGFANCDLMLAELDGRIVRIPEDMDDDAKAVATAVAMAGSADHVLGGAIQVEGMVGRPMLLSRLDGDWFAGALGWLPMEGDDGRPRWQLALPVAFEAQVLGRAGLGDGSRGFVIAPDGSMRWYDLDREGEEGRGCITSVLDRQIQRVRQIVAGVAITRGEVAGRCRICPWRDVCAGELADDLTRVHGVDRKLRRLIERVAPTLGTLARYEPPARETVIGLDRAVLRRLRDRARLLVDAHAEPYSIAPVPRDADREVFLHVDTDPTRGGLVFAHSFVTRDHKGAEVGDTAVVDGPDGERMMFGAIVVRLKAELVRGARLFLTSRHVRPALDGLARNFPDVLAPEALARLLGKLGAVDLEVDLIEALTEWPTEGRDVGSVARHLGVAWRYGGALAEWDALNRDGGGEATPALLQAVEGACRTAALVRDALTELPAPGPEKEDVVPAESAKRPRDAAGHDAAEHPMVNAIHDDLAAVWNAERAAQISGGTSARQAHHDPYDKPTIRPCAAIASGSGGGWSGEAPIAKAYAALTTELPLMGTDAMRPTADGGITLIERLRASLPWMEPAIAILERQLRVALWAGRPWIQFRPMCLVGAPGLGKSHFAREIGRLAGVPHAALDLGGMHDAAALVAVSRGWSSTKPCWPAEIMAQHGCANPLLLLDELDKAGGGRRNGDPLKALLGMVEPGTAATFYDTCLLAPVDLTAVCWIATANRADLVPGPLRSRFDIVEVAPPGVEHLDVILAGVIAETARRWGVPVAAMPDLPPRAVAALREAFPRHRSVRRVSRQVADLLAAIIPARREGAH